MRAHPAGSMTCAFVEDLSDEFEFTVFGAKVDQSLRKKVQFVRLPIPTGRPFLLSFLVQFVVYGILVKVKRMRRKYDLIHSVEAVAPFTEIMTMHFCGPAALDLMQRGMLVHAGWRKYYYFVANFCGSIMERYATRNSILRALVVVSEGLKKEVEKYDKPKVTIFSIPNYADSAKFRDSKAVRSSMREQLSLNDDCLVGVICAMGDWERKGLRHLIEAVSLINDIPLKILVVGPGAKEEYGSLCLTLKVDQRFIFLGYSRDLKSYYGAADFFILPSVYEAWPLVVLEAAAAGLPIVGTPVNGIEEFVQEETTGFFIQRDPANIALVLRRISESRNLLPVIGENAKQRSRNYSRERMSSSYRGLYYSLIKNEI